MRGLRSTLRSHPVASVGLLVLFVVATINWIRDAGDRIGELLYGEQYVFSTFDLQSFTFVVRSLRPEAEAAGLRKGDLVTAVNGRPLKGVGDYEGAIHNGRTGGRLKVQVRRNVSSGPQQLELSIPFRPFTYVGYTKSSPAYWCLLTATIVTPLLCLALGFWVAAVRIYDRAAWSLLFVLLSVANIIPQTRTLFGNQDSVQPFLTAFTFAAFIMGPVALAYFGITFPEPLPFDRRHPWIKWLLLAPMIARALFMGVVYGLLLHHHALTAKLEGSFYSAAAPGNALEVAALAVFFLSLFYKTIKATNRDVRRRLLLLDVAAVVGLLPFLIALVAFNAMGIGFQGWYAAVSIAMLLIFPLTMAYVIVVDRAMDVRVVVRQGIQYLFATGTIRTLQIVISVAIIIAAASMTASMSLTRRVIWLSLGFLLLAAISGVRQRLRTWVDRRFFREAYEADEILSDLAAEVRTMVETKPLLETVATRIAAALHVPRIAILLEVGGTFRTAYAFGYSQIPDTAISNEGATAQRLNGAQHALVDFDKADSWVRRTTNEERNALEELKPELLLPLSLNEKMLGIMSLGAKRSEEPFSRTDIRLLDSVAAQTGLALENGRLTEVIREEAAAREKRNRELELAREVQERLFPQQYPQIRGLEYVGVCRPALGVGGDYYDFIEVWEGGLAIAVGDISGKGISAALLMATLRAFLRGQKIDRQTDLTVVIANLSRLVFESSAHNRYATFFLGVFDSASRVLNYVNAGHNPPFLIRAGGPDSEVLRLEEGGAVVGLLPNCCWTQGQVTLEPGDLLVAYTDGISEAMNEAEEEWGEERLLAAVQANRTTPPQSMLDQLMVSADSFIAGAPQHDDMTIVVLRAL
jgi:phosphoserine phosphatase RsbU/P